MSEARTTVIIRMTTTRRLARVVASLGDGLSDGVDGTSLEKIVVNEVANSLYSPTTASRRACRGFSKRGIYHGPFNMPNHIGHHIRHVVAYSESDLANRDLADRAYRFPESNIRPHHFTDSYLQAVADFREDMEDKRLWSADVRGLQLRIGRRSMVWWFFKQRRVHGVRSSTVQRLGEWPAIGCEAAIKAASVVAGRVAEGKAERGKQSAVKFGAALDAYITHLREQAADRGKPPRWARTVEGYAKTLLRPTWDQWPLASISADPAAVADWHKKTSRDHGPVSANRAAQVLRACYRHTARLDRTLPPFNPTSAVKFNSEAPREEGLSRTLLMPRGLHERLNSWNFF
jgi:hypothetical protein